MTHVRRTIPGAAAMAAALVMFAGCATKGDLRAVRVEMRALGARQDSVLAMLARQSAITQDTLRRQANQLFEIRGDVARQLQLILDELATLRELTGQSQRMIASVRDELERIQRRAITAGPVGGEAVVGPDQLAGEVAATGRAEVTYNTAVQLSQRGNLNTAQRAFEDFLRDFPTHPLAPQALFYLGDILEQQDRLREAIQTFGQIPELHPTALRVPDALYRMGLLHIDLDERQDGIVFLERVVNTYTDSDAAGPARERLRELR